MQLRIYVTLAAYYRNKVKFVRLYETAQGKLFTRTGLAADNNNSQKQVEYRNIICTYYGTNKWYRSIYIGTDANKFVELLNRLRGGIGA